MQKSDLVFSCSLCSFVLVVSETTPGTLSQQLPRTVCVAPIFHLPSRWCLWLLLRTHLVNQSIENRSTSNTLPELEHLKNINSESDNRIRAENQSCVIFYEWAWWLYRVSSAKMIYCPTNYHRIVGMGTQPRTDLWLNNETFLEV